MYMILTLAASLLIIAYIFWPQTFKYLQVTEDLFFNTQVKWEINLNSIKKKKSTYHFWISSDTAKTLFFHIQNTISIDFSHSCEYREVLHIKMHLHKQLKPVEVTATNERDFSSFPPSSGHEFWLSPMPALTNKLLKWAESV